MAQRDTEGARIDSYGYHLANLSDGRVHVPFATEEALMRAISAGDAQLACAIYGDASPGGSQGDSGTLAVSSTKQAEYMVVALVTLAYRAAIAGGADPLFAYDHSDLILQRTSQAQGERAYKALAIEAVCDACALVRAQTQPADAPLPIRRCRSYVYAHLNERITVGGIAQELGLNPTYLSGLFHASEGITLKQFIMNEKVAAACELLSNSQDSIASIASQLGFCSASHLCRVFRAQRGTTPASYRSHHQP